MSRHRSFTRFDRLGLRLHSQSHPSSQPLLPRIRKASKGVDIAIGFAIAGSFGRNAAVSAYDHETPARGADQKLARQAGRIWVKAVA
jgi:hypothetical protein